MCLLHRGYSPKSRKNSNQQMFVFPSSPMWHTLFCQLKCIWCVILGTKTLKQLIIKYTEHIASHTENIDSSGTFLQKIPIFFIFFDLFWTWLSHLVCSCCVVLNSVSVLDVAFHNIKISKNSDAVSCQLRSQAGGTRTVGVLLRRWILLQSMI